MKVRRPGLSFAPASVHWTRVPEFSHYYNASSLIPAYVEPFLVKVLRRAKTQLPPALGELHAAIDSFILQESQHYRMHQSFNRQLLESGYPRLRALGEAFGRELDDLLANRSLRFVCAYAEGFEALGVVGGFIFFDMLGDYLRDADPQVLRLWRWHLAEEFEHRSVCYSVYHALFGDRSIRAYLCRVHGFLYAFRHLTRHAARFYEHLLATDRASMDARSLRLSRKRQKRLQLEMLGHALPGTLRVLLPFYDPARLRPPRGMRAYVHADPVFMDDPYVGLSFAQAE